MAEDDVSIKVGAQIEEFEAHMTQVREILQGLSSPLRAVRENLGEVAEAFLAGFAVEKIHEFYESLANLATQTVRTASLLGTSTEQVAGLTIAAQISGGSVAELTMSMERLGMSLARADAGSEQAKAGLDALGISAKAFRALAPEAQLEVLADKFARLKDGIDKDAIAMAILGRGGAQMIPIFNQGAAAFREFQEMAERAGTAMSRDVVEGFEETHHALTEFDAAIQGVGITIGGSFRSAFDGVVKILTNLIENFDKALKGANLLSGGLYALVAAVRAVVTAVGLTVTAFEMSLVTGEYMIEQLIIGFQSLGRVIKDAVTFHFSDAEAEIKKFGENWETNTKNWKSRMSDLYKQAGDEFSAIWETGAKKHEEIERDKTARLAMTNKDAVAEAMKAMEGQLKVLELGYARTKEMLEARHKTHQITELEMTRETIDAVNQRERAELAAVAAAERQAGLSGSQHQELENKKTEITQKAINERQKLMDKALETEVKNWESELGKIQSAWDSQLRGLIEHTTTFAKAMKAIFTDLALDIVKEMEKAALAKAAAGLAGSAVGAGVSMEGGFGGMLVRNLGSLFSGFHAEGGIVPAGMVGVAGEAGPELVFGGATGASIIPQGAGDTHNHFNIDARGTVGSTEVMAAINRGVQTAIAASVRAAPTAVARYQTRMG